MKRKLTALLLLAGLALTLTACGRNVDAEAESSAGADVTETTEAPEVPDCCGGGASEEKDCCKEKTESHVPAEEVPDCCGG